MRALLYAGAVSLLVSLIGTPLLIRWLRAQGIGQQIREDGPEGHLTKAGTPTMGGLMIVGGAAVGYVAGHLVTVFTLSGLLTWAPSARGGSDASYRRCGCRQRSCSAGLR